MPHHPVQDPDSHTVQEILGREEGCRRGREKEERKREREREEGGRNRGKQESITPTHSHHRQLVELQLH